MVGFAMIGLLMVNTSKVRKATVTPQQLHEQKGGQVSSWSCGSDEVPDSVLA